jgi:CopG family nickel-responsive transcriptional regulator
MSQVTRFGVSLEKALLERFDVFLRREGFASRSEALRELIRRELIREEWRGGGPVAGAITLVYNHHRRDLVNRIMDIQHDAQRLVVSNLHIHLDHDHCLEIIAVKGRPDQVRRLADTLRTVKGVKHGTLSMSSTGRGLA